jgi:ribosomal protein L24E
MKRPLSKYRPFGPLIDEDTPRLREDDGDDILEELRKDFQPFDSDDNENNDESAENDIRQELKDKVMDIPTPGYSQSLELADIPTQHSYREHNTLQYMQLIKNEYRRNDNPYEVSNKIEIIEGSRYHEMLSACHRLMLSMNEKSEELFIQRNPDLIQWTILYQVSLESPDVLDYIDYWSDTMKAMTDDMSKTVNPPSFEMIPLSGQELYEHLSIKSRKYSDWAPKSITKMMNQIRDGTIDSPQSYATEGRKIYKRIEYETLFELMDKAHKNIVPLDLDERRSFARRNPGVISWMEPYAKSQHLIPPEQILDKAAGVELPMIDTVEPDYET